MPRIAMHSRRSRPSCSVIALATVLAMGATPAAAQSFNGTGEFVSGTGSISTGAGTTTIDITSQQAVIDWTPTDNATNTTANIIFQNAGTTATFTSESNFAVLNNIDSASISRAIQMDGTVRARVGGLQRGSVYFYAPGGFVLGGGSVFNVGSLVLSALPIAYDANGFITNFGTENTVQFGQAPNPNAAIVSAGSISANVVTSGVPSTSNSSYVALVAPRVQHTGSILVNGSAALVAAEAATMSFSPDGLFDIQMTVGTDDPNGVIVTGDIGGAESPNTTVKHRVFLAAIPKNDAVTMLVSNGANLGFDVAGAADVDGNAVVLSAGHNIVNGVADTSTVVGSGADANIGISNSTFTSAVFGAATGFADVSASGATTSFASDLTLKAVDRSFINAAFTGGVLDIAGDLNVDLSVFGQVDGQSVTAGHAALYAHGDALVTIGGDVTITANAYGANSSTAGVHAGDGTGGFIQVQGQDVGGSVMIAGDVTLQANGYGGEPEIAGINAGGGFGGTAIIGTFGTGQTLQIDGAVMAEASGFGGDGDGSECFGCNGLGGLGDGGLVQLFTFDGSGSSATFNGTVDLIAIGEGGRSASAGVASANGIGGDIDFTSSAGTLTFAQGVTADATGRGGESETAGIAAGIGVGGDVFITANENSSIQFNGSLDAVANGEGGLVNTGVNGGNGFGGRVIVSANGSKGTVIFNQDSNFFADGNGSDMVGDCFVCGAIGGNGFGGEVTFSGLSGGLIDATGIMELSASGWGGTGVTGAAGDGTGGTVLVYAPTGMTIDVTGSLQLDASGHGGFNQGGLAAGNGTGDSARVHADGGQITVTGSLEVDADGFGGDSFGGNGGTGTGGLAEILMTGSTALLTVTGNLLLEADGSGGSSFNEGPIGDGGDGTGGSAGVFVNGGALHVLGNLEISADGAGGFGDTGGNGFGKWAELFASGGGTVDIDGTALISASGFGGEGYIGGAGHGGGELFDDGTGVDGAHIFAQNGSINVDGATTILAGGEGGSGGTGDFESDGGAGGAASAGWAGVTAANSNSGASSITLSTLNISASASGGDGGQGGSGNQGGNGGAGGDATAGDVTVFANAGNGHLTVTSSVVATAIATGGRGGDGGNGDGLAGGSGGAGGDAVGGHVQVGTASGNGQAATNNLGTATYGSIIADTSATGGDGGDGNFGSPEGTGGDGGTGDGGASVLLVRGSTVTVNGSTQLIANGQGGDGGLGGGELGGGGAGGDGFAGEVAVVSTARYLIPTQHGTLNAGSITGTAAGVGGLGSTNGSGIVEGGSSFEIDSSTVHIGSLDFDITGDTVDPGADPSFIRLTNATVDVDSTFAFSTIGDLSFYIDNGSLGSEINRVGSLVLSAGDFVADAVGDPANVGTAFATNLSVTSGGDFIADANLDVVNGIDITVPGSIRFNNAVSDSFVDLWAQGGSIDIGNVTSGSSTSLVADSFITGGNIAAGGTIFAQTFGGNIDLGSLTSTFGSIFVDAAGDVDLGGDALADGDIEVSATGDIVMLNAVAGESVDLLADGDVTALNLTGGDSVEIEAGGSVDVGNLSAGLVNPSTNEGADYVAAILAGGNILAGNVEAAQHIGLAALGTITTGTIDAGGIFMALGTGNMLFLDTTAGSEVYLADFSMMELGGEITGEFDPNPILASAPTRTGGSITIGDVTTGRFTAAAGTSLTTGIIDSDSDITLDAGAAILTEDLFAGDFVLANGGSITTQNIEANSVDMTSTGGNITINGDVFAFGGVTLDAFGDILSGDITAGFIDLLAGDDITTDDLTTQQLVLFGLNDGITTLLFPGASITLEAGGDIDTGHINSIDGVYANAGGSITTGNVDALDFIWVFAGTDMDLGNLNAGQDIDLESGINPGSGGNMAFGDVSAGTEFDFEADGNVEGGDVVAGATIEGEASGSVSLGGLTAGFDPGEFVDDDNFSVGIVAEGSINVGDVSGAEDVGFGALGNLTTGNLSGGDLIITLVQGDITTGSITTNGEAGQVYMAHASMCETGGGCSSEGDFDPNIVLALEPVPTGGSITINGPVDTGLFQAAAGTTLTTQAMSAEDAIAFAGGLAVINGAWTVGDAKITSNDIDITANGSISANGDIRLVSKNTTRTVVGDGLNLAGYNLSSAEFGKLGANDITIIADTAEGAAPTMFIGTLNANAGGFPDGIDYEFLTGNGDTEAASGTIRVAGNAVFTGMTSENHSVNFGTGLFQLVTEIGSISLFSSGSTLGGELGISANHVHVASASILNQLASDPTYTNYQQDLNETPDVQRPEGVLRADTISIGSNNLQDVLIQNTGTGFQGGTPAGFLARQLFINGGDGAGSINLVINGQVVSEGGTLTGVEARDALVPEGTDITPFTSNSTINGCPLTGVCIIPPPPAPPAVDVVDNFIDIITGDPLGDSDFGNEDDIDDNEEGDQGADNPINPPQPLFDTRPLIPSGDVNDPVSGTGNPALLGSDQQCEEGEQGQCPANPVEGDSQ